MAQKYIPTIRDQKANQRFVRIDNAKQRNKDSKTVVPSTKVPKKK